MYKIRHLWTFAVGVNIVKLSKHMMTYSVVLAKFCTTKQRTSGVILLMVGTSYPALMKFDVYCPK